jgi:trimeric autotransporter adhesin
MWRSIIAILSLIHVFLLADFSPVFAVPPDTPNPNPWITDGTVYAIASDASTVYIGGAFNYLGPNTGYGVSIDTGTGVATVPYSRINGRVYAVLPDGSGGWYIGGMFTAVHGVERNRLAHILPDGTLDATWNPNANGTVRALAISGQTIYAGGHFTVIGTQARSHLAAIDLQTGYVTSWTPPTINRFVFALAVDGAKVYAGGDFTDVGGQTRNRLAAFDTTGALISWDPGANNTVYALAADGSTIYAGGDFVFIGGEDRGGLAAIDGLTGVVTPWMPSGSVVQALAIAISGGTVYTGGPGSRCCH